MAKALISIECLHPSDWDPMRGEDSKLLQFLAAAGWELENIDADSVQAFPDTEPAQGIEFNTNEMPVISFSRIAAVSAGHPGIVSTIIHFTEPAVVRGRARREPKPEMKTGAARVRVSTPRLLNQEELGFWGSEISLC